MIICTRRFETILGTYSMERRNVIAKKEKLSMVPLGSNYPIITGAEVGCVATRINDLQSCDGGGRGVSVCVG